MRTFSLSCLLAAVVLTVPSVTWGQPMPDPRQMSGVPLPSGDVPVGTVTVRVIRGSFDNPVPSLTVEIAGEAIRRSAVTDAAGRVEFTGLTPGSQVTARATVAGESLESQVFTVPASGGIRLMLVAGSADGAAWPPGADSASRQAPGPAVVIGDETRFVFEMGEDGLSVFYVLQIVNRSDAPAEPERPLVFELPAEARRAAILDGSAPQATVAGRELRIAGPIPPGAMAVQLAYSMPLSGPELVIEQPVPIMLTHVAVVAQKVGEMGLASPQIAEQRTMPAQGNLYIAGRGGPVPAGQVMRFHFTGVPHHPTWPRNLALGLAVLILVAGAWAAIVSAGPRREQAERRQLEAERDRLFAELSALELRHRAHEVDPELYAHRRRELVAALEGVYTALDEDVVLGKAS
jgi:hypothetical protein